MNRINRGSLVAVASAFLFGLAPQASAQVPQPAAVRQQIALGLYRSAEATVNRALLGKSLPPGIQRESLLLLVEIYYRSRQYDRALVPLREAERLLNNQRQIYSKFDDALTRQRLGLAIWQARIALALAAVRTAPPADLIDDEIPLDRLSLSEQADRLELLVLRAQLADLRKEGETAQDQNRRWSLLRQQAETLFRQALVGRDPANLHASILLSLARCFEGEGKPERAVAILRVVALPAPGSSVNPRVKDLRAETARILRRAKRFSAEADFWNEVLAGLRTVESDQGLAEIERLNLVAAIHFDRAETLHLGGAGADAVAQELGESEKGYGQALSKELSANLPQQAELDAMKTVSLQGLLRIRLAPEQWSRRLEYSLDKANVARAVTLHKLLKATRIDGDPLVHDLEAMLGAQYLRAEKIPEAKESLDAAYQFFETYRHAPAMQVQLLVLLAEIDRSQHDYGRAQRRLEEAASCYGKAGLQDENLRLWIKVYRGRLAAAYGQFSAAQAQFRSAIHDADAAGLDTFEAGNLARLGMVMLYKGSNRLDQAEDLCRKALLAAQDQLRDAAQSSTGAKHTGIEGKRALAAADSPANPRTADRDAERVLLPFRAALAGILLLRDKLDDSRPIVGRMLQLVEDPEFRDSREGCEVRHLAALLDFFGYKSSPVEDHRALTLAANAESRWQTLQIFQHANGQGPGEARTCYYVSQLSYLRWQRQAARDAASFRAYKNDLDKFNLARAAYQEALKGFEADEWQFKKEKEVWSATSLQERRDGLARLNEKWTALDLRQSALKAQGKELNDRSRALESRYDALEKTSPKLLLAADDWAQQATTILEKSPMYPNLQYVISCHRASVLRARAAREPEKADEALHCLKRAVAMLESPRASQAEGDISRAEFLSQYAAAYDQLIQWLARDDPRQALVYAEMCRSRAFLDWIGLRVDPGQSRDRGGPGRILTFEKVQAALDRRIRAGELAIYYHVSTLNSYLFVIGLHPAVKAFPLERDNPGPDLSRHVPATMVATSVDDYLELISQRGRFPKASAEEKQRCISITDWLLPSQVRKDLAAQCGGRTLVISPHGALERLPFEALLVREGNREQFLIDYLPQTSITYAPSLMILDALEEASHRPTLAQSAVTVCCSEFGQLKLPRLEAARDESNLVAKAFGSDRACQLVNVEATEAKLRATVAQRMPACLHFATHRVSLDGDGGAALVLHPADARDNGLLTLDKICNWSLNGCELAVVSACRTNEGGKVPGEMSMSFSRAFLTAGSHRIVASQWPVNDRSACEFATGFLGRVASDWRNGKPCDYAATMIAARRELRSKWAKDPSRSDWSEDPFYWAPFILIGPPHDLTSPAASQ